jgi:hypothetical protein
MRCAWDRLIEAAVWNVMLKETDTSLPFLADLEQEVLFRVHI